MEITELGYELKLTNRELLALQKGLKELYFLQEKLPDVRNGFDLNSQGIVAKIYKHVNNLVCVKNILES